MDAIRDKRLPPSTDARTVLARWKVEKEHFVRGLMSEYLGAARCKEAVPPFLDALRMNPADSDMLLALGRIGDPRAVPAVIESFEKSELNRHIPCAALGYLATPEAVDFLIAHLDEYGAVEALAEAKCPKSLPALKRRLDKLTRTVKPDELDFALAKVAVTQLSYDNPASHLLALAEDRSNSDSVREQALWKLDRSAIRSLDRRLLRLFRADPAPHIKRLCVEYLTDSRLQGVTEAMVAYALSSKPSGDYREQDLKRQLLRTLNQRLGYYSRDMTALQDRIRRDRETTISH